MNNELKLKAKDNICERPSKCIHIEQAMYDIDTLTTTDLNLIRKNIYYARSSLLLIVLYTYKGEWRTQLL